MKKGMFLAITVVVLGMTGATLAQDGDLGIDLNISWVSKYIWRGFDRLDDKAAFQPSVNIDLYGTGLSFNVWGSLPGSSGTSTTSTVNAEEWNYTLAYSNIANEDQPNQMNYSVGWRYYNFPDSQISDKDLQEIFFYMELPGMCPIVTPHYMYSYIWTSEGGGIGAGLEPEGSIHLVGFDYDIELPALEAPLVFSADAVYNDGQGGTPVDHDWSHIVWGLKTTFECPNGGKITPAVYYQTSMDDSVNTEDELYTGISYSISF